MLAVFFGCKVPEVNLAGKYIDLEKDDTLTLRADKTYEFEEKLNKGEHGWNTGNWNLVNGRIRFSNTSPLPIVGCKVKVIKKGMGRAALQLNIVQNSSSKKFRNIETRVVEKNGVAGHHFIPHKTSTVFLKSFTFEKLEIRIPYFPVLRFSKDEFEEKGIYQVIVYPLERLYELDKLSYRYKRNRLINRRGHIRYDRIVTK